MISMALRDAVKENTCTSLQPGSIVFEALPSFLDVVLLLSPGYGVSGHVWCVLWMYRAMWWQHIKCFWAGGIRLEDGVSSISACQCSTVSYLLVVGGWWEALADAGTGTTAAFCVVSGLLMKGWSKCECFWAIAHRKRCTSNAVPILLS